MFCFITNGIDGVFLHCYITTANCNELLSRHYQLSRVCFSSLRVAETCRVFSAINKGYKYVSLYCECVSIHYELLRESFVLWVSFSVLQLSWLHSE